MTNVDSTWINLNPCRSHMFISEMTAIKLIRVNMNLKMKLWCRTMASIENEIIGIIFIFISITILCIFSWKEIQLEKLNWKSVVPMANNIYFIQWIITSYMCIIKMAINHREIILVCIKIAELPMYTTATTTSLVARVTKISNSQKRPPR